MNSSKLENTLEGMIYPNSSSSFLEKLLSSDNNPHPSNLVDGWSNSAFHIFLAKLLHILISFELLNFASFSWHPKHNKSSNSGNNLKQSSGIYFWIYSLITPSLIILQHAASLCL